MSTTFQRQREALGLRLRELRRDARLTGRDLALRAGWHPSKISKIEAGKQTPSDLDLETWARLTDRPTLTAELITTLRTLEEHYVAFRRMFRGGMAGRQRDIAEIETQARAIRNFEPAFVPGLLQTPEYARARLAEAVTYDGATDDLDAAVFERMQRQQVLYRSDKRHHFVVTEAVLRYRLCSAEVLANQLDRLVTLSTMNKIRFGVIPFSTVYPVAPAHGFWIYDDQMVFIETLTAELKLTQPTEIGSYQGLFDELAAAACYGREARAIILAVLTDLTESLN